MKLLGSDGFEHVVAEHQVLNVGRRNQHALRTGEALDAADVEEALDFFVYSADGLYVALLVHGAGDGEVLTQGQIRERRYQRVDLGGAGAVAVHARVGLLETDAGRERQWLILCEAVAEESRDDLHALVVKTAAQIGFVLDVDETGFAERCAGGDANRFTKGVAADFKDAQAIDLTGALSRHIH